MLWFEVDGSLLIRSSRVRVEDGNLTLYKIRREDHGKYECIASNIVTRVVTATQLIVERESTFLSTHAYCLFVCLFVCTATDFSAEYKASGVKFCEVGFRRPRQRISHFGALCSPKSQKSEKSASARVRRPKSRRCECCRGSACVDIGQSPLTYLFCFLPEQPRLRNDLLRLCWAGLIEFGRVKACLGQTDWIDGQTPDRYITIFAKRGQRDETRSWVFLSLGSWSQQCDRPSCLWHRA